MYRVYTVYTVYGTVQREGAECVYGTVRREGRSMYTVRYGTEGAEPVPHLSIHPDLGFLDL